VTRTYNLGNGDVLRVTTTDERLARITRAIEADEVADRSAAEQDAAARRWDESEAARLERSWW
jgi:hypothetical protein